MQANGRDAFVMFSASLKREPSVDQALGPRPSDWLKSREVVAAIEHFEDNPSALCVSFSGDIQGKLSAVGAYHARCSGDTDGTIRAYHRDMEASNNDGRSWQKDTHLKLKLDGEEVVQAYYSKAADGSVSAIAVLQ